MAKKKQFAVLGLGRFGMSLAKTLSENGFDVLSIVKDYGGIDRVVIGKKSGDK